MQSQYTENQRIEDVEMGNFPTCPLQSNAIKRPDTECVEGAEQLGKTFEPMCFRSHFEDCMELYADAQTVANYLNSHQGWFCRCAHPMKAEPLGNNGYILTIGRFGAFGYEVEPKIGLELLPPEARVYRIQTISIAEHAALGYEVDYQAALRLLEVPADRSFLPQVSAITRVEWELDLAVDIHFPKFIYRLQRSLLQKTGDGIVHQIVRQVSRRLTLKVQEDFHKTLGISFEQKHKHYKKLS